MANTTTNTKTQGQTHGQQSAGGVLDTAKDVASNVADKAKQAASSVASTVGNVASNVGDKVDTGVSSVGSGMQSLADTIRDKGPASGVLGGATSGVAGALDSAGKYLQEEGVSGMAEDVTDMIRRHPIPALLVGIGIGYLLARVTGS